MTDYEAYDKLFSEYPDVVTIKEISKMLGLGIRNTYKLVSDGKLHSLNCCKKIMVTKVEVINYVLQSAQQRDDNQAL